MPPERPAAGGAPAARPRHPFVGFVATAAVIVALDQWTKALVRQHVDHPIVVVEGFLRLVFVENPGAAFSLLAGAPPAFRDPFFLAVGAFAVVLLVFLTHRLEPHERPLRFAYGGVLGGAVGNLIDRIRHGAVTDFVDVHWGGYHWPAFNVADSSITVAVLVVAVYWLRPEPRGEAEPARRDDPGARFDAP